MVYYINTFEDDHGYISESFVHYSQQQAIDDAAFMMYPHAGKVITKSYKHTICVTGKAAEILDLTTGIESAMNEIYEDIMECKQLANITSIDMISRESVDACRAFNRDMARKVVQMEEFRGKYAAR